MRRPIALLLWVGLASALAPAARAAFAPAWLGAFGSIGYEPGAFQHCGAVAIDSDGDVFVADVDNPRVQRFSPRGQFQLAIGPGLPDTLAFSRPTGLACSRSGRVYVADWGNDRVVAFTNDGQFVTQWGGFGSGPGQFYEPSAIAVDAAGHVFVAEHTPHRVQVFTADGGYIGQWTLPRYEEGYTEARAMITTPTGLVYVTDGNGQRVLEYTLNGLLVNAWGRYGTGPGELWGVTGIGVDGDGNVYVAEEVNARVQVFSADGAPLAIIGGIAAPETFFASPSGLAFDPLGDLFVSDWGFDQVDKFGASGLTPTRRTSWGRIKTMFR